MVVGSQDGQIRLYTGKQFTRANTAVPGLGAPITSVDVTYDGKWILATTKSYLMVVKTFYKVQPAAAEAAPLTCNMGLLQHLICKLSPFSHHEGKVLPALRAVKLACACSIDSMLHSLQDKSGKETNGFKSRMGSRGAAPRLLRLKPEDLAQVGCAACSWTPLSALLSFTCHLPLPST